MKWEENKKWQKTVDRLKEKVRLKEEEVVALQKPMKLLRDRLARFEREKSILVNRLKSSSRTTSLTSPNSDANLAVSLRDLTEENDTLKRNNNQLEEDVSHYFFHMLCESNLPGFIAHDLTFFKVKITNVHKQNLKFLCSTFQGLFKVNIQRVQGLKCQKLKMFTDFSK